MRLVSLFLILFFFLLGSEARTKTRIKRPKTVTKPKESSSVCKTVCDNFDNKFDYYSGKCYGAKGESLPEKPTPEQRDCYCKDSTLFLAFQQCYECRYSREKGSKEGNSQELDKLGEELNEDIALCNAEANLPKKITPVRLINTGTNKNDASTLHVSLALVLLPLGVTASYFLL